MILTMFIGGQIKMANTTAYSLLEEAIQAADITIVKKLLGEHLEILKQKGWLNRLLSYAAKKNKVEMVAVLVESGANINAPKEHGMPEGVIDNAAAAGATAVVQWLLENGAKVNQEIEAKTRCFAVTSAVRGGHLDVVKLLVERGRADINAVWAGQNALSAAILYGKKDIEAYLRSKGALEPWQLSGEKPSIEHNPILIHIEKHLGKPKPLSFGAIIPGDPNIRIHAIPLGDDEIALVTSGMSDRPMNVPPGRDEYRFAELVIYLPAQWPMTAKALQVKENFWPFEWLRRIAAYPHENNTWLGGASMVFANGDPPKPLAPNTQLTCLLVVTEDSEFGQAQLADGRQAAFYTLFPLYTSERDFERKKGTAAILKLFEKHGINRAVDVRRANVAKSGGE